MTKINRQTQKIFGINAGSKQITAFGTAKNANPTYTTNVNDIQNANFLQGWSSALLPDKAPWEEDMNALFYAITSQLAYLYQQGLPEYDSNTEYPLGALTKIISNEGDITIYKSKIDNNLGNPITNNQYWQVYLSDSSIGIATYEIGLPQPTLSNTLLSNEIWLAGQEVSRTTYSNLFAIYGTTYGNGDGTTTFNLPDFTNRVMWGASSFGYISAGLPNITGCIGNVDGTSTPSNGCFYRSGTSGRLRNNDGQPDPNVYMDASRVNGIYGNSSTVQPPAIKVRVKTRYQ